jgi:hypothetical protein
MKSPQLRFVLTLCAGLTAVAAFAGTPKRSSSPIIITPPAIPDGSIASRAPFPAARPFDDVKKPDGQAIDTSMAPNTPSTTPQTLPAPAPQIAILVPQPSIMEPGTSLTGRAVAGVSAPLDSARIVPSLQATTISAREETLNDIENRVRTSETAIAVMKRSVDEMSEAGRTQFHAAHAEANDRVKELKRSIKAARDADEAQWDSSRSQVASHYAAYADAMGRIDAAAGITPAP